jgi:hypothetical protein
MDRRELLKKLIGGAAIATLPKLPKGMDPEVYNEDVFDALVDAIAEKVAERMALEPCSDEVPRRLDCKRVIVMPRWQYDNWTMDTTNSSSLWSNNVTYSASGVLPVHSGSYV